MKRSKPAAPPGIPTAERRIITRKQLADRLSVSERTVIRLEASGYLPPPVRIGVKRVGHWSDTVPRQP